MDISVQDLRSISLFASFADSEIADLGRIALRRDYAPHQLAFTQGEPSPGLWFVRRGRVRLYRVNQSGREFTLCIARPDNMPCLGGCPLMDGETSPASAEALEPTTVHFVERERAREIARRHKAMGRLLAVVLANHSRHLARLSSSLALRCSLPRLADSLLTFADERGRKTERGIELNLDITQELLASVLGTTPQMIAQDFLKLEQAGILDARGKHILILQPRQLAEML
jgi:CRP/FNR family cyclic AMP-dependent transcriptional regulator